MKFSFVALLFSAPIFGMNKITSEYPELMPFFASEEFQACSSGCEIVLHEEGLDHGIAELRTEVTKKGMLNLIRLNALCVDKKVFSAEEIKFIVCHEVGHLNDKGMLRRLVLSEVGVLASRIAVLSVVAYLCIQRKWDAAFKTSLTMPAFFCAGSFFRAKVYRDCEFFADEYAVKLTKNKDAALSALAKRCLLVPEKQSPLSFVKTIKRLFEDHPTVDARCAHIKKVAI